jgi:hypothetical protein
MHTFDLKFTSQLAFNSDPALEAQMKGTNSHTKWKVSPSVRGTVNKDGAVLLDIDKGLCYSLNVVGGKVWQVLAAGHGDSSVDDIVETLAQEFTDIPRAQLTIDTEGCLQELESEALIRADDRALLARA